MHTVLVVITTLLIAGCASSLAVSDKNRGQAAALLVVNVHSLLQLAGFAI